LGHQRKKRGGRAPGGAPPAEGRLWSGPADFYLPDPFRIVIDLSTRPPVTEDKPGAGGTRDVRRVARLAEQLAEAGLVDGEHMGLALGEREIPLVGEVAGVGEEQRRGERGGNARVDRDDPQLAGADPT
jgi:hypothetical protein